MTKEQFVLELEKIGAIKFGSFTLKSGLTSPFYFDLRDMISFPFILEGIADLLVERIKDMEFDVLTGIPYTALPIASLVASKMQKPLVYMRKEEKAYGTGNNVIGKFEKGAKCLVIDDLITTGASKIETAEKYEKEGIVSKDFVVVIDRSSNGTEELAKDGYKLHSLITLDEIVQLLKSNNGIFLLMNLTAAALAGWDPKEANAAQEAIAAFKATDPDLELFFDAAHGYAVFPSIGKAGMGIGGAYGTGVVYEKGKEIGTTTLKQVSIGFEFGGEHYREIIFFDDEKTLYNFKQGNYELDAQASAVALKKGASKNADYDDGVAVFTQTKGGLMFDASIGGQKFTFEPK